MKEKQPLWTGSFIGIIVVNLLTYCGFQMLQSTLPLHVKALGGTDNHVGWISGGVAVASLLIRPFSGLFLDKLGRKLVLVTGLCILILASFSFSLLPVVSAVIAIRFVHGLGWGAASTASNTIAADWVPKSRFGEGMGFFSLSGSVAMALFPGIGLWILAAFGFARVSLTAVVTAAMALLLCLYLPYKKVAADPAVSTTFAPYEKASLHPTIVIFFCSATYGSIIGFVSLYSAQRGIASIGSFFFIYAGAMLVSRPAFGRLVDRFGFQVAVYPGLGALALSLIALSRCQQLWQFLLCGALYGLGFGAVQSSLQSMSVLQAPANRMGAANATFFTGFDAGIGCGSVVAGLIASRAGYANMFWIMSVFAAVAAALALVLLRQSPTPQPSDSQ